MLFLKMEDPKKDINLYINSPGGQITSGLAIYDTMNFLGCDINTYCIGLAASMAALLLSAGSKNKRYALPNSRIMIHQPYGGVGGAAEDIRLQAKEILHLKQIIAKIMSEKTNKPVDQILKDSERDFYMSAEDALNYGIVDKIAHPQK